MERLLLLLSLALWLFSGSLLRAESDLESACGFVLTPSQAEREMCWAKSDSLFIISKAVLSYYQIPLAIHIVRKSDGSQPVSGCPDPTPDDDTVFTLKHLDRALADLNEMFVPVGWDFFQYGPIDYVDDDDFYCMLTSGLGMYQLVQINNVPEAVNIYFMPNGGGLGSSIYVPGGKGIKVNSRSVGRYFNPSTLAHEMGHYFRLMHTHQLWPDGSGGYIYECPDGSNCSTTGDLICDTPADPTLTSRIDYDCFYDHSVDPPPGCDDTPYDPQADNLMSYARTSCRNYFSPQQIQLMTYTLENERPELEVIPVDACCGGRVGDVNGLGGDEPSIGDVAVMIDAKFISLTCDGLIDCLEEADINQSGGTDPSCGDITVGDISTLIDYLFITGPSLGLAECL